MGFGLSTSEVDTGLSLPLDRTFDYDYPRGLNLRPDSELHASLVSRLLERGRRGHAAVSDRYESWRKIDQTVTAYIPLDELEKADKYEDERRPIRVTIPVSFATMETYITYCMSVFGDSPIFPYEPVGPEDVIGNALLEMNIENQMRRSRGILALHTMWQDSFKYGIGALSPVWEVEKGTVTRSGPSGYYNPIDYVFRQLGFKKETRNTTLYEGNVLHTVDPYSYFPDPDVSAHEVQRGEFVGWMRRDSKLKLLEMEAQDTDMFNVKYLGNMDGGSSLAADADNQHGRLDRFTRTSEDSRGRKGKVDTLCMYVHLIPKEWKLGTKESPEKWLFFLSGDKVITKAMPLGLSHGKYPIGVSAPDYDGRSPLPLGRMELVAGLQEAIDWMFDSHMANVRKAVNDRFLVDPMMVNMHDLMDNKPGGPIRLRKAFWGRGVDKAIEQFNVTDITRSHVAELPFLFDTINRVVGATDSVQGIARHTSERTTAAEVQGTRSSSMARLEKMARLMGLQAHYELGHLLASHTQQFMQESTFLKISGRWEDQLRQEYGNKPYLEVSPRDILIGYDVLPKDGVASGNEDSNAWTQLFQVASQSEELSQTIDIPRVFMHIARQLGAKNPVEFLRNGRGVQPQVMPDQQVQAEAQAGNIVPVTAGGESPI